MKAKITKIDHLKGSRTEAAFRRVYFQLEDGSWAKTDVVPKYRNFKNWKFPIELFEKGEEVFLDGIQLRRKQEVDADSPIQLSTGFETKKSPGGQVTQEKLI